MELSVERIKTTISRIFTVILFLYIFYYGLYVAAFVAYQLALLGTAGNKAGLIRILGGFVLINFLVLGLTSLYFIRAQRLRHYIDKYVDLKADETFGTEQLVLAVVRSFGLFFALALIFSVIEAGLFVLGNFLGSLYLYFSQRDESSHLQLGKAIIEILKDDTFIKFAFAVIINLAASYYLLFRGKFLINFLLCRPRKNKEKATEVTENTER